MPGRLPTTADFPSSIRLTITPPPSSTPQPTNVLLLLHGLGDTPDPFTQLSKRLSLPETACLSLQGPTPLPFELGGFHWGDDIIFDQGTGNMDVDTGFEKATSLIKRDIVEDALVKKCGYLPRDIVFFGLGQGGMAALATAATISQELGGVVSVGGPQPSATRNTSKSPTPVLILGGSSNSHVTITALTNLRTTFQHVEYQKWERACASLLGGSKADKECRKAASTLPERCSSCPPMKKANYLAPNPGLRLLFSCVRSATIHHPLNVPDIVPHGEHMHGAVEFNLFVRTEPYISIAALLFFCFSTTSSPT